MRKALFVISLLFYLVLPQAGAELVPGYDGHFSIQLAGPFHGGTATGAMSFLFEGENFSLVRFNLDNPIRGSLTYESREQGLVVVERPDALPQLSCVFKMNQIPHRWYFVFIANEATNPQQTPESVFEGTFYKVAGSMEAILEYLKNGVAEAPSHWKVVGSGHVASQLP